MWPTLGEEWIVVEDNPAIEKMPKILLWNYSGASNPHFHRNFMELVRVHKPLMVILTKTRIGGTRANLLCRSSGFPDYHIVDLVGFAMGIWLLWNQGEILCDVLDSTEQEVHTCIQAVDGAVRPGS